MLLKLRQENSMLFSNLLPAFVSVFIGGLGFPAAARADFEGGDTLKTLVKSNWYHSLKGGADFKNANSRLELLVRNPATINSAVLLWLPNNGSPTQNWYAQADAYLDLLPLADQGDGIELSLGIMPSEVNGFRFFSVGMLRSHDSGTSYAGISVIDSLNFQWERLTNTRAVTLRLHFNKDTKTITPSWDVGSGWKYGEPRNLDDWNMKPSETFQAVLLGRNEVYRTQNGAIHSGQAYFKNFHVGNASPEIVVGTSALSELQNNKKPISFGVVKVGGQKKSKTFRIRNHGTADLTGLNLSVTGAHAEQFTLSNIIKNSLSPGEEMMFKISFRPTSPGLRKATILLTSNDPDEPTFGIKVSGRSVE
jgi:Abnormal spindle-like microcephaly-assoc'd, ASPM-SPD-2-Hydin